MNEKNPLIAATLSLIPGLGQLYIGRIKKGAALLCIDAGLVVPLFLFPSRLTLIMMGGVYLFTMVPAALESYLIAKTGHTSSELNSKKYIVFILFTTGLTALPLLWQSARFSKRAKILWTATVFLLALLFFGALYIAVPR